jgi:low affinity Fe/Cu permease
MDKFIVKIEALSEKTTKWIGSVSSLILHTVFFAGVFTCGFLGFNWDTLLLILTTAVSLEAIYLAIFIQMSLNRTAQSLQEVSTDIDEIQEDIDEIQEDVDEIQEDVDEIQKTKIGIVSKDGHISDASSGDKN